MTHATPDEETAKQAEQAFAPLAELVEEGFSALLFHFYGDLPWDKEGRKAAVRYLLESGKHEKTFEGAKQRFGFDLRAEFEKVLRDP